MVYIDYYIDNFCKRCEHRFSKEFGIYCPKCSYQARTVPRKTKKIKSKIRQYKPKLGIS